MIEQIGVIVAVEPGYAWVEAERRSGCDSCAAESGCGTGVVAKVLGRRKARVRVHNLIDAQIGDEVVIGLGSARLVQGSAMIYLAPLIAMIVGGWLGEWLGGEISSVIGALFGLSAILLINRLRTRALELRGIYQPKILRRSPSAASMVR